MLNLYMAQDPLTTYHTPYQPLPNISYPSQQSLPQCIFIGYIYSLGHCQFIPGMADFSQGFSLQLVGRVKEKKKPMATNLP